MVELQKSLNSANTKLCYVGKAVFHAFHDFAAVFALLDLGSLLLRSRYVFCVKSAS